MITADAIALDRYAASRDALAVALADVRAEALAPSPHLSISEWVESNFQLSRESSAEPGEIRLYGYQRGIMDAFGDPSQWGVVLMKSARIGGTMILKASAAYFMEHDPAPVLIVMPTEDDARDFTKTEIEPMIRDTPALAAIAGGGPAQDEWHTKFTRKGSVLRIRGAFSPDAFRRLTTRVNLGDEIDGGGWDNGSAKSQGDKVRLLRKRGETFWNAKLGLTSTPTIAGQSRIEEWFKRGDQRRYFVPCPHCDEPQVLEWGGREEPHGLKWPAGRPQDAYYVCRHNGCIIEEKDKHWMDERGEWIATNPDGESGLASFHINALYSLFPAAAWGKLAQEFTDIMKRPPGHERREAMRTFANLVLGEPFEEDQAKALSTHELMNLCELYDAEVPQGARLLTAFVDVQSGAGGAAYFETSIYGHGVNGEKWLIGHWILKDHPIDDDGTGPAWQALRALLRRPFRDGAGREHYVQGTFVDSGGDYTTAVYRFTKAAAALNVWAFKGYSNTKGERRKEGILPRTPTKTSEGSELFVVDVDQIKDAVWRHLGAAEGETGRLHFPVQPLAGSVPCDATFFTRLTRERPRAAPGRPGRTYWTDPSDNEPWDCLIGATAAMLKLTADPASPFSRMLGAGALAVKKAAPVAASPAPATPAEPARAKNGGYRVSNFMRRR